MASSSSSSSLRRQQTSDQQQSHSVFISRSPRQALFQLSTPFPSVKGKEREVTTSTGSFEKRDLLWATQWQRSRSAALIRQAAQEAGGDDSWTASASSPSSSSTLPLQRRADAASTSAASASAASASTTAKPKVAGNLPLQLVIIIGSVVIFAMFLWSLAWLCRRSTSKSRAAKKRSLELGGQRRKNTWSPGGSSSIYTYETGSIGSSHSRSNLSDEKRRHSKSMLSPVSPMPVLLRDDEYRGFHSSLPAGACHGPGMFASGQQDHGHDARGWELYDNPVPGAGGMMLASGRMSGDVEAAQPPPARRPSFIDRLLAHRADPKDARLLNQLGLDRLDTPMTMQASTPNVRAGPQQERAFSGTRRKISGSALLSALNDSLHAWPSSLRNNNNNTANKGDALATVESDFEGTIGGKDGEIPMAKRVEKSQGRFTCDESTEAPTPWTQRQFRDQFSPLPNRLSTGSAAMPVQQQFCDRAVMLTPAVAEGMRQGGEQGAWADARRPSLPVAAAVREGQNVTSRPLSFAELQRRPISAEDANRWTFQSTIDKWVQSAQGAAKPPPSLSRQGSAATVMTTPGLPATEVKEMDHVSPLERISSIRPHFAATTTLSSWLIPDNEAKSPAVASENGLIDSYMVVEKAASELSYDTDFDRKRGELWETTPVIDCREVVQAVLQTPDIVSVLPLQFNTSRSAASQVWSPTEEQLEEERRQIDRRQKMLLKEKRKSERRISRQQQAMAQAQAEAQDQSAFNIHSLQLRLEQEKMMAAVCVVDMQQDMDENDHRIRLAPAANDHSHAPILSLHDQVVMQSRRKPVDSAHLRHLLNRPSARAMSLSPPESPLTSASEGPARRSRPGQVSFLVESSRSGHSSRSGSSRRSVSHGVHIYA